MLQGFRQVVRRALAARLRSGGALTALVAMYAFALLGGMVLVVRLLRRICNADGFSFDTQSLLFLHAHRTSGLDSFFQTITWAGSLFVLLPAAVAASIWLFRGGRGFESLLITVGLLGASGLSFVIKNICERDRPDLFAPLTVLPVTYSFPSSHAAQICAFALALFLTIRRLRPRWQSATGLSVGALGVCVVLSRAYLQVHYPSDIFGGVVLGAFWVLGLYGLLGGSRIKGNGENI